MSVPDFQMPLADLERFADWRPSVPDVSLFHQNKRIEDRVIEQARGRRRPLMPNDETVIRVIVENFLDSLKDRGEWPPRDEDELVDVLVACVGGMEFEFDKEGGFMLRMVKPDDGMFSDAA